MRARIALLALLPLTAACPGRLADPSEFQDACQMNVETQLFATSCGAAGCHSPPSPQAGLDLVSPGVGERLRAQASTCGGQPLVASTSSYLLVKVAPNPPCGAQMPLDQAPLTPDELTCLQNYVAAVARGDVP